MTSCSRLRLEKIVFGANQFLRYAAAAVPNRPQHTLLLEKKARCASSADTGNSDTQQKGKKRKISEVGSNDSGKRKIGGARYKETQSSWQVNGQLPCQKASKIGLLQAFRRDSGVQSIEAVMKSMKRACHATQQTDLFDNYAWREHLVNCWLKLAYGIDDIRRSRGRSGSDCHTQQGNRANIEIKTSLFRRRRRLTAAYELGQFSRQHTPEVRAAIHNLDGVVYAIFAENSTMPVCLFCLHGHNALSAHSTLLRCKQKQFVKSKRQERAKKKNDPSFKGGRDTVKVKCGDLLLALSGLNNESNVEKCSFEAIDGFDVWVNGERVTDWSAFTHKIVREKGIDLRTNSSL